VISAPVNDGVLAAQFPLCQSDWWRSQASPTPNPVGGMKGPITGRQAEQAQSCAGIDLDAADHGAEGHIATSYPFCLASTQPPNARRMPRAGASDTKPPFGEAAPIANTARRLVDNPRRSKDRSLPGALMGEIMVSPSWCCRTERRKYCSRSRLAGCRRSPTHPIRVVS
jgi:hypothetical protein